MYGYGIAAMVWFFIAFALIGLMVWIKKKKRK